MTNSNQPIINILFVHYGEEWIRGSERCLLDLLCNIDRSHYHPILWCNSNKMAQEAKLLNVEVIEEKFTILFGWKKPKLDIINYLKMVRSAVTIIKKYTIDIVHSNSGAPNQWLLPATKLTKKPLITQLHAPYIFRDRLTLGLYQSDLIVGVSHSVVKPFIEDGMTSDKIRVIHNGIDTKKLKKQQTENLRNLCNIPEDHLVMITVGSLIYRKGHDLILHALRKTLDKDHKVSLVLIGNGEEKSQLKDLAKVLKIQKHVHFLGEKKQVQSFLSGGADLFVSAAREEAFGLVLAEAGLAKLPVIAPSVDGIPEVVDHNKTGLLYQKENITQLEAAILHLIKHKNERIRLGKNGYHKVETVFSIHKNVRQFEAIYNELSTNSEKSNSQDRFLLFSLAKKSLHKLILRFSKGPFDGVQT